MKILFAILALITLAAGTQAQGPKIMAENVRGSEKVVKGAPFSAEAVSESVQMLADGNRIVRRSTSRMYRDSEGRFRREDMPKQLGVPGANVEMPASILILDPVTGYRYQLDTKKNIARQSMFRQAFELKMKSDLQFKLKMQAKELGEDAKEAEKQAREAEQDAKEAGIKARRPELAAERAKRAEERSKRIAEKRVELEKRMREKSDEKFNLIRTPHDENTKTESLGVKNIGGVEAEGTRNTTTIAAGAIGNERAIEVVYERWYSKDLQLIVLSKHNDPRFGEQMYELTNIRREEPSISLFSPPADYTIIEDKRPQPKPVVIGPKPVVTPKGATIDGKPPIAPVKPVEPTKPVN